MMFEFGVEYIEYTVALLIAEAIHLRKSERKPRFVLRLIACVLLLVGLSAAVPTMNLVGGWEVLYKYATRIVLFLLTVGASALCFDNNFYYAFNRCMFGNLTYCCGYVWGLFFRTVFALMFPLTLVFDIISFVVCYALFFALSFQRRDKKNSMHISRRMRTFITLFVAMFAFAFICVDIDFGDLKFFSLVIAIMVVYLCFLLLNIFADEKQLNDEYNMLRSMLKKEIQQYETSKELIDVINIKCHDLKHQIHCLREGGGVSDNLLDEMERTVDEYDAGVKTGNEALDIVMTEKGRFCARHGIKISCIADGGVLSFMLPTDIYSLMGNILDNAIEAVGLLEDRDMRTINFTVRKESGLVRVRLENYFAGNITIEDGLPRTTKDDSFYHGYGVKSIRLIAEKYEGIASFSVHDNKFVANIIIPYPKKA